jgi:arylsulfatase B
MAAGRGRLPENIQLDGVNLLPYLTGDRKSPPHETLYWRMGQRQALRHGHMKLLRQDKGEWELYDLKKDISESKNLAADQPEVVEKLSYEFAAWNSDLAEPMWAAARARPRRR